MSTTLWLTQELSRGGAAAGRYLTDADGVVQHGFGVGGVVAAGQLGAAKVRLQQQVGLCVGAVVGVRIDLQGELLSQLAVQLVLVVSDWQLCVLFCVLKDKGSAMSAAPRLKTTLETSAESSGSFRLDSRGLKVKVWFNLLKHVLVLPLFFWEHCCKILFFAPHTHRKAALTNENLQTCS